MMAHRGVGKTCGGGGASIRMPTRAVLQRLEVDTQLQGGREERRRLASVRGRSTGEARGGEGA
jgi:hypothetical protein